MKGPALKVVRAQVLGFPVIVLVSLSTSQANDFLFMEGQIANPPISSGIIAFIQDSQLNANIDGAVGSGIQDFFDQSRLNASSQFAVEGGSQSFQNESTLNALATNAIAGGQQEFRDASSLNALSGAIGGGEQEFFDESTLNATGFQSITGGTQLFFNGSALNASAGGAIRGGQQVFRDESALNASETGAVGAGVQSFLGDSALNASTAGVISGGTQLFRGDSTLNASAASAISSGVQEFFDESTLNAEASDAVRTGNQTFFDVSTLDASAADAVSGGNQTFNDDSTLEASAEGAISGGLQTFNDNSTLDVLVDNALTTGADVRFDNSQGGAGGVLRLNGNDTVVGSITSLEQGSGLIFNGDAGDSVLTIDGSQTGPSVFSGSIEDGGVSGTIGLVVDDGDFTLTGTADHSGGTTINNEGTFNVGDGGDSGSLSGAVVNDGVLAFNRSDQVVFQDNIGGDGQLIQDGGGILILTGEATHTGGTTINDGSLLIAGAGSLTGDVTNDGLLRFDRPDAVTFSGDITGEGRLVQDGSGELILTGDSALGGALINEGGTLQIGDGGNTGSLTGDIRNDGVLAFDRGGLDFDGDIEGTGQVVLESGEVFLTGDARHEGGTVINAGSFFIVGDSQDVGSLSGDVYNNGNLSFFRSDAVTFSGDIDGEGVVDQAGGGVLTLTGDVAVTGETRISRGSTIQIGDGGTTGSIEGDIFTGDGSDRGTLIFNRSDLVAYDGSVTGSGDFEHVGTGTTILTGSNTFNGTTDIRAGTLVVNGSLASSSTVHESATLGGDGTVRDVDVAGGTISPGNSIGSMQVDGDLSFSDGGVFAVEVNAAGESDQLVVMGTADLEDGRVSVQPQAGNYAGETSYTILEAESVTSEFDSVTIDSDDFAFLDAGLATSATDVLLTLERNDASFEEVASTRNAANAADAITRAQAAGQLGEIAGQLTTLDADGAQTALESLSGNQLSQATSQATTANTRFGRTLSTRSEALSANPGMTGSGVSAASLEAMAQVERGNLGALADLPGTATGQGLAGGSGFWLTPEVGRGKIDSTSNSRGVDYTYGGLSGGFDHWFSNTMLLGASLSYSETRGDDVDTDSIQGAIYGRWLLEGQRYLDASAGLGRHDNDSERRIQIGDDRRRAEGDFNVTTYTASVELGQDVMLDGPVMLTPFVGLDYAQFDRDSFTESGAGEANLAVDSDTQESLRSRLGVKARASFGEDTGRTWTVDTSAAWAHEFADRTANTNAAFEAAPEFAFETAGPELSRNSAQLGAGLTTSITDQSRVRVAYQGELASTHRDHSGSATFEINW